MHLNEAIRQFLAAKNRHTAMELLIGFDRTTKPLQCLPEKLMARAFGERLLQTMCPLHGVADDRDSFRESSGRDVHLAETQHDVAVSNLSPAALEVTQRAEKEFFGTLELLFPDEKQTKLVLSARRHGGVIFEAVQADRLVHEFDGSVSFAAAVVRGGEAVVDARQAGQVADGARRFKCLLITLDRSVEAVVAHVDRTEVLENARLQERSRLTELAAKIECFLPHSQRAAVLQQVQAGGLPIGALGEKQRQSLRGQDLPGAAQVLEGGLRTRGTPQGLAREDPDPRLVLWRQRTGEQCLAHLDCLAESTPGAKRLDLGDRVIPRPFEGLHGRHYLRTILARYGLDEFGRHRRGG